LNKLLPRYSDKYSHKFWRQINSLVGKDQEFAYTMGVLLQNIEEDILRMINSRLEKKK